MKNFALRRAFYILKINSRYIPVTVLPSQVQRLYVLLSKMIKLDWFYYASTNYKFKSESSFEALCDHNAKVAHQFGKFEVYKNWMILKTIFKDVDKYEPAQEANAELKASNLSPVNSKQVLHKFAQSKVKYVVSIDAFNSIGVFSR